MHCGPLVVGRLTMGSFGLLVGECLLKVSCWGRSEGQTLGPPLFSVFLKPKPELVLALAVLLAEQISLVFGGLLVVDVAGYATKFGGTATMTWPCGGLPLDHVTTSAPSSARHPFFVNLSRHLLGARTECQVAVKTATWNFSIGSWTD
jgi:hypothetical protein